MAPSQGTHPAVRGPTPARAVQVLVERRACLRIHESVPSPFQTGVLSSPSLTVHVYIVIIRLRRYSGNVTILYIFYKNQMLFLFRFSSARHLKVSGNIASFLVATRF